MFNKTRIYKLTTLDEVYQSWEQLKSDYPEYSKRTFGLYCEVVRSYGWRIL